MVRIPEFYPRRQGRPMSPDTRDLETGQTYLYSSYIALMEEYMGLKDIVERLLNDQIAYSEKMLNEARQIKLHLASLSEENVQAEDVEDE